MAGVANASASINAATGAQIAGWRLLASSSATAAGWPWLACLEITKWLMASVSRYTYVADVAATEGLREETRILGLEV